MDCDTGIRIKNTILCGMTEADILLRNSIHKCDNLVSCFIVCSMEGTG